MLLLSSNFKKGYVKLKINLADDLWYLSHIISQQDKITAKSERKIKIGDENSTKTVRKTVVLTLTVEDLSLSDDMSQLRVKGLVVQGTQDVASGSYHTFGLQEGDVFSLVKDQWPRYLRAKLDDALKNSSQNILFVLFDREKAFFSLVDQTGTHHLSEVKADVQKKQFHVAGAQDLYGLLCDQLVRYDKQYSPSSIIAASPAFFKHYVEKRLSPEIKKKVVFLPTTSVSKADLQGLLTRPELSQALASQRVRKEEVFRDELLKKLRDNHVVYGFNDVCNAASIGAISQLGVSESYLQKAKEEGFFEQLDKLMKTVDGADGAVHLLLSPQVTKTIDGLGGVVAITRWDVE